MSDAYDNWKTEDPHDDSHIDMARDRAYEEYLDTGELPDGRDAGHVNEALISNGDCDLDDLLVGNDEVVLKAAKHIAAEREKIIKAFIAEEIK